MKDILTFNTFITQDVLIFFYYIGAVIMPVVLFFKDYLIKKISLLKTVHDKLYAFYRIFSAPKKVVFWMIFITIFFCMELCWRMIFEVMIGYFDMHNYLYQISR